jgi:hypothetical protein
MSEYGHDAVSIHPESTELVEELKPEWMAVSAFVDGTIWMFYGHLRDNRRLTVNERRAIMRLKESGVDLQLLADAFGVTKQTIGSVQKKHGHGEKDAYSQR